MTILRFLWTALLGGVIVILPVALMTAGVVKAVGMVRDFLEPIAARLPSTFHYPTLVAAGLVLAVFFAAGLLIKTALGRAWKETVDRGVLEKIPGYVVFRTLTRKLGGERGGSMPAALIRLDDQELIGFVMERHSDGRCAVFVPAAPTPAVGSLIIVTADRVRELDVPMTQVIGSLSKWGAGTAALMSKVP